MITRVVLIALLLLVLAWAFWRFVDGVIEAFGGTSGRNARKRQRAPAVKLVRDPVCGTYVSTVDTRYVVQRDSGTVYFCSDACRRKFQAR